MNFLKALFGKKAASVQPETKNTHQEDLKDWENYYLEKLNQAKREVKFYQIQIDKNEEHIVDAAKKSLKYWEHQVDYYSEKWAGMVLALRELTEPE